MGYKRIKFEQSGFDETEYNRRFHLNQAEYIRLRLRCVRLYQQGLDFEPVSAKLGLHPQTVRKHVNTFISGGFEPLCQQDVRPQESLLSDEQAACFKQHLLEKRPEQVGLQGNIWTGHLMRHYLLQTYGVSYKSGIYDLLERMKLTHRDGGPAEGPLGLRQRRPRPAGGLPRRPQADAAGSRRKDRRGQI